jgi:hypothetical protein
MPTAPTDHEYELFRLYSHDSTLFTIGRFAGSSPETGTSGLRNCSG